MKLNLRLVLITFAVTLLVSVTAILIFFSLTNKILFNQHSKTLFNAANHFAITLDNSIQRTDTDFQKFVRESNTKKDVNFDSLNIDFMFTLIGDSLINQDSFIAKKTVSYSNKPTSIHNFVANNPNIILKFAEIKSSKQIYYYGRIIDTTFLNQLSKIIRSDIVLVLKNKDIITSNQYLNQNLNLVLDNSIDFLKNKRNYELYSQELSNFDFLAILYSPKRHSTPYDNLKFIVYSLSRETAEYRDTMQLMIVILTSASIALSLIFVLIFTTKFRKQLSSISRVVEKTRADNLTERVDIISNDELGELGKVLNKMLDEIQRREEKEQEFINFVTLINEKATLKQISESVLNKIVKSLDLNVGIFYVHDGKKFQQTAYSGLNKETISNKDIEYLYAKVIESKEPIEFLFESNAPQVHTSLAIINLTYIIIFPITFNKEIIGILELGAITKPGKNVIQYLDTFIEQLSVGLSNAIAFEKLENLVSELKLLNTQYQMQNAKITEQKEQLQVLHNELKGNTKELEEQRAKAVESAKVKSQFLANMSHELRTPLNSILGLSELILNGESLSSKNSDRLKIVINNGKKLLNIINNILNFSKLESTKIEINPEIFVLKDFINEISNLIEPLATEKNLTYNITYEHNLQCSLLTDKLKLEQVISNLLSNAVKFTETGEISLIISLVDETGLKFIIKDTGIGIDSESKELIFEEFRQTSEGSSRRYGGTGLGLAIAKRMLDILGGSISVNSEVGLGSIFTITIPNIVNDVYISSTESLLKPVKIEKSELQKSDILLFCNNPETIDILTQYLSTNNFNVIVCENLESFFNQPADISPKAVLLDYLLFKNPFEVVKQLNNSPKISEIPKLLVYFPIGEKSGFILNTHEFLFAPLTYDNFISQIKFIQEYFEIKIQNVVSVGNSTFSGMSEQINLINIKHNVDNIDEILKENPDMLIIDLESENLISIDLLYSLLNNKKARLTPTLLLVPKELPDELLHKINLKLFSILEKNIITKIDSLRILREKLKIGSTSGMLEEEVDNNEDLALIEEDTEQTASMQNLVMIVDDDKDTLFTVGQIVESLGYKTIFAKDGLECLLILETKHPDLILLDIMMPRMDGFETIKRINGNPKFSSIPVIALTAHAMLEERDIIIKNGFADLVTKPIDIPFLAAKVNQNIK